MGDTKSFSKSSTTTIDSPTIDLRSLLADEVPNLAEYIGLSVFSDPYLSLSFKIFRMYLAFLVNTWWGVVQSGRHVLGGHIATIDFLTLVLFSTLVSVVLTFSGIMCLIYKLPFVESVFGIYMHLNGGFSFMNGLDTHMFSSLTKREVAHSKAALSSTAGKHFNLEIAKILPLLPSVVYEPTAVVTRASLYTLP